MKAGDKVIFVGGRNVNSDMNLPKKDTEVCVITRFHPRSPSQFELKGYEFSHRGTTQSFHPNHLRKLITDHTFTNELTEELANKPLIKEGLEKVKEKEAVEASNNSRMSEAKLSVELYNLNILCQE